MYNICEKPKHLFCSSVEMKDMCTIPSPPQVKRVVRWYHVFSLDDYEQSTTLPQVEYRLAGVSDAVIRKDHEFPMPNLPLMMTGYQTVKPKLDVCHHEGRMEEVVLHNEYYSMGEAHEQHDKEMADTKSPMAVPIACVVMFLLMIGVFIIHQADDPSQDHT